MTPPTSASAAQQDLKATEAEIQAATDAYDAALANGDDADIAGAEEALAKLRRKQVRLQRQVPVLQTVEAADAKLQSARERARIDETLVRCRADAVAALDAFAPVLREQLAKL